MDLSCSCQSSSSTPTTTPKRGKRQAEFFDLVQLSLSLVLTSLQPKGFLLPVSTRVLPGSRVFPGDKLPLAFPSKLTTVGKCDQGRKIFENIRLWPRWIFFWKHWESVIKVKIFWKHWKSITKVKRLSKHYGGIWYLLFSLNSRPQSLMWRGNLARYMKSKQSICIISCWMWNMYHCIMYQCIMIP